MKSLTLQSDDRSRVIVVVFDPGDDPIAGLTSVAGNAGIDAAHFTGIGAFEAVTVGWFDLDARDYRRIQVDDQVEILALVGDITRDEGEDGGVKVHAHVVLGRSDGSTVGGHLLGGRVRPTLEVVISETPAELRRRYDPTTGLALIDLAQSSGVSEAGREEKTASPDRPPMS